MGTALLILGVLSPNAARAQDDNINCNKDGPKYAVELDALRTEATYNNARSAVIIAGYSEYCGRSRMEDMGFDGHHPGTSGLFYVDTNTTNPKIRWKWLAMAVMARHMAVDYQKSYMASEDGLAPKFRPLRIVA